MINVQQNEKEYTISVTIPFKKVAFSETPYKEISRSLQKKYLQLIL